MRRIWLIFAQAVTLSVAVLFVLTTLKPEWLPESNGNTTTPAAGSHPVVQMLQAPEKTGTSAIQTAASYAPAASSALPAVVLIYTSQTDKNQRKRSAINDPILRFFFDHQMENTQQDLEALGSGVIVSHDGYILTNNHVVEQADSIEVALSDGRKFAADLVGRDPDTDLAVLHVQNQTDLPAITLARSDALQIGDVVLAIGNPFGVGQTVTMGIVSALGRNRLGISTFENYIQTDAAINPGNSGGALIDSEGNLVGINTAIFSRSGGSLGIGFAIPVSLAQNIMAQIIATGEVTRGWVGTEIQEITPDLAAAFSLPGQDGTLIVGVLRGSPAQQAGIKPGDVLVKIGSKPINSPEQMLETVAQLPLNETVEFELIRAGKNIIMPVTIGRRPSHETLLQRK